LPTGPEPGDERDVDATPETIGLAIYLVVVVGTGVFVSFRVAAGLRRVRQLRSARVRARLRFDAIQTEGPVGHTSQTARDRALESIERQSTVTSRAAIPTILVFTALLAGIPFLGEIPAAIVTVVAAGVTVLAGITARPLIENAIAGLVLSGSKLVNLGDTVQIGDIYGTVEDITPTHTTVKVWDWRRWVVPNVQMIHSSFYNYSLFDRFLWSKVEFWVSYDADLEAVRRVAIEVAESSRHFSGRETPECWVMELGEHAVHLWVAAWAETPSEGWLLTDDVRTQLVKRLHQMGVLPRVYHHRVHTHVTSGVDDAPPVPMHRV